MDYISTRDKSPRVSGAQAILQGIAPDGGLFIPAEIPVMDFEELCGKSYVDVAFEVLQRFLPEYDAAFLRQAIAQSYGDNFGGKAGHISRVRDNVYALELWHGPTCAFKDYALQLMPRLLGQARVMLGEKDETIILVATSGDTGKAALEGYKNREGVKIAVFYPNDGTSEIQRLQMATQDGDNVAVYGVNGNFDDAQRGVKLAFCDETLAAALAQKGAKLSSANSINWGRLVPQIVYYVTSYLHLCEQGAIAYGDAVDYYVPTGNFGDILAGYYAKLMGLPLGRLVCASNNNNVLTDFLLTGKYDTHRPFYKTSSPSMDILVSSNLERLLRHESKSGERVCAWMQQLAQGGGYVVDEQTLEHIRETFEAGYANEQNVEAEIRRVFEQDAYLCDPHTAVAMYVARTKGVQARPAVVVSTASPFKFCGKVLRALGQEPPADEFDALAALEQASGQAAPPALTSLRGKAVRFDKIISPEQIALVPMEL